MDTTSFSIEACEPASDGGVVPGLVPIPNVDPDALEEAAGAFRTLGEAIEGSGSDITSAWASLTGVYTAPESDTLLSVLEPVSADGTSVATGVGDAASALESFAETARELKSRLTGLKTEAESFRADVGWDEEWLDDEDERERNNDLNNRIANAVHEFQEAERDCANKIGEHYGGTWFTGHSDKALHDQTATSGDRAYQLYGTMSARTDQANPWGSPVDAPTSALEDAFWGLGDIVVGAVVGLGIGTGLYRDGQAAYPFGAEHGQNLLANWEDAQQSFWALSGSDAPGEWASPGSADAQYENARGPWLEVGDSIVPVSEWDDRPMYTVTHSAGNAVLMLTPMGWARTFLDNPDLGSGASHGPDGDGAHGDGPTPVERGSNGVGVHGGGLHGTDSVNAGFGGPTAGLPGPGVTVGGMHESLAGLENQLGGSPTADPGPPTGPTDLGPGPETSGGPTAPAGDAPAPTGRDAPASTPDPVLTPSPEEGGTSGAGSTPTTQELRDGTSGSDADAATDPWTTSPVTDASNRQESPTAPIAGPSDGDGSRPDAPVAVDDTSNSTGTNGGGAEGNGPVQNNSQNGTGDDQDSPTPATGGSGNDEPPRDGPRTGGTDDGESDVPENFSVGQPGTEAGFPTREVTGRNMEPGDQSVRDQLSAVRVNTHVAESIMGRLADQKDAMGGQVGDIIASGRLNSAQGYREFLSVFGSNNHQNVRTAGAELRFADDLVNQRRAAPETLAFPEKENGSKFNDVDVQITAEDRRDYYSYQIKQVGGPNAVRNNIKRVSQQLTGEMAEGTNRIGIIESTGSVQDLPDEALRSMRSWHREHGISYRIYFEDGVATYPPDAQIYP